MKIKAKLKHKHLECKDEIAQFESKLRNENIQLEPSEVAVKPPIFKVKLPIKKVVLLNNTLSCVFFVEKSRVSEFIRLYGNF